MALELINLRETYRFSTKDLDSYLSLVYNFILFYFNACALARGTFESVSVL